MAMFPCSIDAQRYAGKQQTAFLHVVEEGSDLGGKQRLCPEHFDKLEEYLMMQTWCVSIGDEAVQLDTDAESPLCAECKSAKTSASLFAYTFSNSFPKRQFWGRLCHECVPAALQRLKIST